MKHPIETNQAPKAIGPYSQAIKVGQMLYCSGQIPLVPTTMKLVEGDSEKQAIQVLENLKAVIEAAGGQLSHVIKVTVYLTNLSSYPKVNEVMSRYFEKPYPARATIGVSSLPLGASIEIEAIAALPS
ncbi:MAG: RidA family protein [Gammaproteobacteria bacterium]|nr:RidA family protein [Gammaproteobacteria bacterium]